MDRSAGGINSVCSSVCNPDLFVSPAYAKKKLLSKGAEKLAQFPLIQIVRLVLAINDENIPNTFVLQATREIANRAADPNNEEDFYDAGAISALVDLLIEDEDHLRVEALNALINISMTEQGTADIIGAGIMMLIVALIGNPASPIIQVKAAWLLINLTFAAEVREVVRQEGGVVSLLRMVQSNDIRVQRMALKAINNTLTDCEPFDNQEAFIDANGFIIFLKMLLTVDTSEEIMIQYLLNILSALILCDRGMELMYTKGVKILARELSLFAHNAEITSMVIFIFRQVSQKHPQELSNSIPFSMLMDAFKLPETSDTTLGDLLAIFFKILDSDSLRQEFITEGGIPILFDLLYSNITSVVTSGAPLLYLLAKDEKTQKLLLGQDNDVIRLAVTLLDFPDRTGILVSFSLLEIFLQDANGVKTFAEVNGITKLLSFAFSGEKTFVRKALRIFSIISNHEFIRASAVSENAIFHLVSLVETLDIVEQNVVLQVLIALLIDNDPGMKQIVESGKLQAFGSFLSFASSSDPLEVQLSSLTRNLLHLVKNYLPRHQATLSVAAPVSEPQKEQGDIQEPCESEIHAEELRVGESEEEISPGPGPSPALSACEDAKNTNDVFVTKPPGSPKSKKKRSSAEESGKTKKKRRKKKLGDTESADGTSTLTKEERKQKRERRARRKANREKSSNVKDADAVNDDMDINDDVSEDKEKKLRAKREQEEELRKQEENERKAKEKEEEFRVQQEQEEELRVQQEQEEELRVQQEQEELRAQQEQEEELRAQQEQEEELRVQQEELRVQQEQEEELRVQREQEEILCREREEIEKQEKLIPDAPFDEATKQFIDKLAALVVTHGDIVEEQAKQTQGSNPKFSFLLDEGSPDNLYYQWMKNWLREPVEQENTCSPLQELEESIEQQTGSKESEEERMERLRKEGEEWKKKQEEEERKAKIEAETLRIQQEEAQKQLEIQMQIEKEEQRAKEAAEQEEMKRKFEEEENLAKLDADLDEINDLMNFGDDLGLGEFSFDHELLEQSQPPLPTSGSDAAEPNVIKVPEVKEELVPVHFDNEFEVVKAEESTTNPDAENLDAELNEIESLLGLSDAPSDAANLDAELNEIESLLGLPDAPSDAANLNAELSEIESLLGLPDAPSDTQTGVPENELSDTGSDGGSVSSEEIGERIARDEASAASQIIPTICLDNIVDVSTHIQATEEDDESLDAMLVDLVQYTPRISQNDPVLEPETSLVESTAPELTEKEENSPLAPVTSDVSNVTEPSTTSTKEPSSPIQEAPNKENEAKTTNEAKKIVKCSFHGKNVNLRVSVLISLEDLMKQLSSKFQQSLEGATLKYKDDCDDLVLIESSEDLELAFELSERRLDLVLEQSGELQDEKQAEEEKEAKEEIVAPPPPPPAPLPPPPPPAVIFSLPKVVRKPKNTQAELKPQSMHEEMLGFKLKSGDLNAKTRGRKEIPVDDSGDMVGLLMKAMDSRRVHIEHDDNEDAWDDDDDWDM